MNQWTLEAVPNRLNDLSGDVIIITPASAQVLRYNGANWVNAVLAHTDLSAAGSLSHAAIDSYLNQSVQTAASPVFAGLGLGVPAPAQKLDIEKGHIRLGQVSAPSAPTVAVNVTAGILTGSYYYRISFVTALGETETGALSAAVSPVSQQVDLTAIPVSSDSAVTARKIYRTIANGGTVLMKLVATINNNTTTTYTDNIADGSLGVSEPRVNTTGGIIYNGLARMGFADNTSTAWGINALSVNTGHNNTAVGMNALSSNTTGYYNTAMGMKALTSNSTGSQNTAMGERALFFNTTGDGNSAVGVSALYANTTGSSNTAVGNNTLRNNTTGYSNSASGENALYFNTIGYQNSGLGKDALFLNTTGYDNTAVGMNSLQSNTTGFANSALGRHAGRSITTGDSNTFLGNAAGYNVSQKVDAVNSMALGNGTYTTLNNQVVIGNDSITQTLLKGSVGIGTASPAATALLDLTSVSKGFLAPRMTTVQRDAIISPALGLIIYNNTTNKLNFHNGTAWEAVTSA